MRTPKQIAEEMLSNDLFSQWLGIQILEIGEGYCKTALEVRDEMVNGLGLAHGGIAFALADSTFAFAANSVRSGSPSIQATIHFLQPVKRGDMLIAESRQIKAGKKLGLYEIEVRGNNRLIAVFQGTCLHGQL